MTHVFGRRRLCSNNLSLHLTHSSLLDELPVGPRPYRVGLPSTIPGCVLHGVAECFCRTFCYGHGTHSMSSLPGINHSYARRASCRCGADALGSSQNNAGTRSISLTSCRGWRFNGISRSILPAKISSRLLSSFHPDRSLTLPQSVTLNHTCLENGMSPNHWLPIQSCL